MKRDGWTFIDSGPGCGADHMEIDRNRLESFLAGRSGPVFRIYTWHPPAISLGAHQDPDRDLDRAAAAARGIDVVVRPTGGRAIYHDQELTYAVVTGVEDPVFGGSIAESHGAISLVFQAALARLGIVAELGPRSSGGPGADSLSSGQGSSGGSTDGGAGGSGGSTDSGPGRKDGLTLPAFETPVPALQAPAPCFAATTRTELTVNGRKILGSAQRRSGIAFLQHGSLLTGDAHLDLVDFLPARADLRARLRADLERKTTTVAREAGRDVSLAELKAATGEALGEMLACGDIRFC